jgi:ribosomal protein L44E
MHTRSEGAAWYTYTHRQKNIYIHPVDKTEREKKKTLVNSKRKKKREEVYGNAKRQANPQQQQKALLVWTGTQKGGV